MKTARAHVARLLRFHPRLSDAQIQWTLRLWGVTPSAAYRARRRLAERGELRMAGGRLNAHGTLCKVWKLR